MSQWLVEEVKSVLNGSQNVVYSSLCKFLNLIKWSWKSLVKNWRNSGPNVSMLDLFTTWNGFQKFVLSSSCHFDDLFKWDWLDLVKKWQISGPILVESGPRTRRVTKNLFFRVHVIFRISLNGIDWIWWKNDKFLIGFMELEWWSTR